MARDLLDSVIDKVNENLPQFNEYTLKGYRQEKIAEIPDYLDMVFREAVKRYGCDENGEPEVIYKGHRFLTPEEILEYDANETRFSRYVDVLRTELALAEFVFEHRGQEFNTKLYIPYMVEDAIIINGSRYYPMFALTDKVLYHINKDNGIGIKILCAHLRFWRNKRYTFKSTIGNAYGDHLIMCKIHMRAYKHSSNDLVPVLMLYPIVKFGLKQTLAKYGIPEDHISASCTHDDDDEYFEYFEIRPELIDPETGEVSPGLYLKVHKDILKTQFDTEKRIDIQIVTSMHYILQYFNRCKNTNYTDNVDLVHYLNDDPDNAVYKVILGKTIFGINYENEVQVMGHTEDHLESLEVYMDPDTKRKLSSIGVECRDVYDLIHYISLHMDEYVANYYPSNIYNKQMNVLDLLLGSMVNTLFTRIYALTNKRKQIKEHATNKIMSSLRIGSRVLTRIYDCRDLINSNPSTYNNNGLFSIFGRKKRAMFTTTKSGPNNGQRKKSEVSLLQDPEHRTHSSLFLVESGIRTQTTDPTKSGTINPFLEVTPNGNIIIPEWLKPLAAEIDKYVYFK